MKLNVVVFPDRIGPYRVKRHLGAGAFSDVYEAEHATSGQPVALKVFASTGAQAGFVRELSVAYAERHPNLLEARDLGYGANAFVAFPLARGGTLRDRLARGDISRDTVRHVTLEVGRALASLHARGVVHGDVKPENILFDVDASFSRVRLADYGASSRRGSERRTCTPAYLAPEASDGLASPSQDLYALALLVHEGLTGRRDLDVPPEHEVLARALSPDPRDRYPSAVSLVHALDVMLAGPRETMNVTLDDEPHTRRDLASGRFAVRKGAVVELRDGYGLQETFASGRPVDLAFCAGTPVSVVMHLGTSVWVDGRSYPADVGADATLGPCTIRRFAGDAIVAMDEARTELHAFPSGVAWALASQPLRALFSVFTADGDVVIGVSDEARTVHLLREGRAPQRIEVPRGVARLTLSLHDAVAVDRGGAQIPLR
ncbi:MAG: serine/threonine-protein kinase [Polyangiaceae bacterium]